MSPYKDIKLYSRTTHLYYSTSVSFLLHALLNRVSATLSSGCSLVIKPKNIVSAKQVYYQYRLKLTNSMLYMVLFLKIITKRLWIKRLGLIFADTLNCTLIKAACIYYIIYYFSVYIFICNVHTSHDIKICGAAIQPMIYIRLKNLLICACCSFVVSSLTILVHSLAKICKQQH